MSDGQHADKTEVVPEDIKETTIEEITSKIEDNMKDFKGQGDSTPSSSGDTSFLPEKKKTEPTLEDLLTEEEATLTEEELKTRHELAQKLKCEANNYYKESSYIQAITKYTEAVLICPLEQKKDRAVLYANRAAALMGDDRNQLALDDCNKALVLDENYLKALERRARLNKQLDYLDEALSDYQKLLKMKPGHCEYHNNVTELTEAVRVRNEEAKEKMLGTLKQLGNSFLKNFGMSLDNFKMVPNGDGGYSVQMS